MGTETNRREASGPAKAARGAPDPRRIPISAVGLPRDVLDSLAVVGITTIGDFAAYDPEAIMGINGVGTGSVRRVRRWLELQGLDTLLADLALPVHTGSPRRNPVRLGPPPASAILPIPDSLTSASVPLYAMPARVANLLRRHGIRTLQELHLVLLKNVALEGFGVGTRWEVVESLPRIYAAASQAGRRPEGLERTESLGDTVGRLRKLTGRPVSVLRVAQELGMTEKEAVDSAQAAADLLLLNMWCLTPDERGVSDAVSVSQPGELGEVITGKIQHGLSEREYQVLVRWAGIGMPTLRHGQIARDLERSRERIRQLRQRALTKLCGLQGVSGILTAMASSVSRTSSSRLSEEEFSAAFRSKYGLLLGPGNADGFAYLCLHGTFNPL